MDILPEWETIEPAKLRGTLLVVGMSDAGKSTFARYLYGRLRQADRRVAYLDGDPGQGRLGPPATMTLTSEMIGEEPFRDQGAIWRTFVGSTSPAGHMLPVVVGAARLVGAAQTAGIDVVIYDTTGLIDPNRGGTYLKLAKINLLRPSLLFAIQRDEELDPLLRPLLKSQRLEVVKMPVSPSARSRDLPSRRASRAEQFAQYFAGAEPQKLNWADFAVFPSPAFRLNLLVAMEDADGYVSGLGIVRQITKASREVTLLTPLSSLEEIISIQLGGIILDPRTFSDQPVRDGE